MSKNDPLLVVFNVSVGIAAASAIGLIAAAALMSPQLGVFRTAAQVTGQLVPAWIAVGSAAAGVLTAGLYRRGDTTGYYLAIVLAIFCAVVGLASAGFIWVETESALPGLMREMAPAYAARETRNLYALPAYVSAALHLAIGAAGTAGIVGVLLLRRRA